MANRSAKKSAKSSAADQKVSKVRNTIIAVVALLVIGVIGYGVLYSTGITDTMSAEGYSEGNHYDLIEGANERRPGSPVVISEYFSYGCIHCKNFDPLIKDFEPTLPSGSRIDQVPVTFNPSWALLARAYLALEAIDGLKSNHERMFNAIHNSGRQFNSIDQIADFVEGKDGVTKEGFMQAYNSSAVRRKLGKIDASGRSVGITSVPSLIVDNRYRVNMSVGRKQSLEVARFLVEKIQAEEAATASATQAPSPEPEKTERLTTQPQTVEPQTDGD